MLLSNEVNTMDLVFWFSSENLYNITQGHHALNL